MAKMNKTEISAKNRKRKNIKVFVIRITPKTKQHMYRVGSFLKTEHETTLQSGSSSRERHSILAAILDFVEKAEKRQNKFTGQIF